MDTVLIAWASVLGAVCAVVTLIRSVRRATKEHDEDERDRYAKALDAAYKRGYEAGTRDAKAQHLNDQLERRLAELERQTNPRDRGH